MHREIPRRSRLRYGHGSIGKAQITSQMTAASVGIWMPNLPLLSMRPLFGSGSTVDASELGNRDNESSE